MNLPTDGPFLSFGLFWGVLVVFLLGEGLYRLLARFLAPSSGDCLPERAGFPLLLACAGIPWVMLFFDLTGIPIGRLSLTVFAALIFTAGFVRERGAGAMLRALKPAAPGGLNPTAPGTPRPTGPAARKLAAPAAPAASAGPTLLRSPAALVLALGAGSLVLFSLVHVSLVPVRSYDALVGYDAVGKILAFEGKYRSSLFTRLAFNAQCAYAPFTAANNGLWYLFEPPVPRLWIPLLTAGFLFVFWARVRRWTGSPTAASLAAFLLYLPSSFAYQLTEAQTDTPSMIFSALAAMAVLDLARGRGGFAAPAVFTLISATGRTENVLFGAAFTLFLLARRPTRSWKAVFPALLSAGFFLFWNVFFIKGLIGWNPGTYFRTNIDFSPARMAEVFARAFAIVGDVSMFGEFYVLVLLLPVLWFLGRMRFEGGRPVRRTDTEFDTTGTLLLLCALMFVLYMPFFYMWNEEYNPLWSMRDTFKRGFLRFIPPLLAAFVAAPPVARLLARCDAGGKRG